MRTVHSEDHRRHFPQAELSAGQFVTPYERPSRVEYVLAELKARGLADIVAPDPPDPAALAAIHPADYLDFLRSANAMWRDAGREGDAVGYVWPVVGRRPLTLSRIDALLGRYSYDAGTPITSETWDAAYWGAQ
ncbi:MAG: histone deacetylase family protein, partial [Rubrimonas sp.]